LRAYALITIVPQNGNNGWLPKKRHGKRHGKQHLQIVTENSVTESVTECIIYTASWKSVTESDTCDGSRKKNVAEGVTENMAYNCHEIKRHGETATESDMKNMIYAAL